MSRRIVNCISTIEELDVNEFNKAGCGVELQDFVEPNLSEDQIEKLVHDYSEELPELTGIKSLHGPFLDLKPSSPDKDIRRISQLKYRRTLQIAHELDVQFVVFHSQINPYLNQSFLRELNNRQAAAFWKAIMEMTPYKGKVVIENVFEESPYMLKELIDHIGQDRIAINLDIGHMNIGHSSLSEWVHILGEKIEYLHIHGNNGMEDQHLVPTDEKIRNVLRILENEGIDPVLALEYEVQDPAKEIKRYSR